MTTLPRNILVAVDFGDASARAVAVGGELAARTDAVLWLLHAESLDVPPYFTRAQLQAIEGQERNNLRRAGEYLRRFGKQHTTHAFQTIVESRTAADAILHASKDADLVVMGTHGRRGPSRWWLGSVADRVLRETVVPLLVIRAGDAAATPQQAFARGLVLVGAGTPAERTRRLAREIAARVSGFVTEAAGDDAAAARAGADATWAAVPVPVPRTASWRSHVGEPLLQSCAIPVLFVPEVDGGPVR